MVNVLTMDFVDIVSAVQMGRRNSSVLGVAKCNRAIYLTEMGVNAQPLEGLLLTIRAYICIPFVSVVSMKKVGISSFSVKETEI